MKQIGQDRQKTRLHWKQASYGGCVHYHQRFYIFITLGVGLPYEQFGDMLVVSCRGINQGFWSHVGCS